MLITIAALVFGLALFLVVRYVGLAKVSRDMKPQLGLVDGRLLDCRGRLNCVSSDAGDPSVDPLVDSDGSGWERLATIVGKLANARLVERVDGYLHFEFSTPAFGFTDDVEFRRDVATGTIAVRSASRIGRTDLGVNRRRVELIRAAMNAE